VLPSFATTTAAASTTPGKGILSEHNKLSVTGSCVVKTSGNAKQCAIYVTYTNATGTPVLGVPVTIATMNGEGMLYCRDEVLRERRLGVVFLEAAEYADACAYMDTREFAGTRFTSDERRDC
jgi:hypothetical protein